MKTSYGDEEVCVKCGGDVHWEDCYNCEDGYSHHDCGEDCCICRNPQLNIECDICNGEGGWFVCLSCGNNQNKPEVNKSSLSQNNKKEDGFPPMPKGMGIQPTIL